jgi:hypothetical protein
MPFNMDRVPPKPATGAPPPPIKKAKKPSIRRVRRGSPSVIIGASERLALPDWGITQLRAKVDTGARTSALHVAEIVELPGDWVRFLVVLDQREGGGRVPVEAPISRRGRVRSSTGNREERLFVETRIVLGPVDKPIEVSLARRGSMLYRMLLGRTALAPEFLVDASRRYVHSKRRRRVETAPVRLPATGSLTATPPSNLAPGKPTARKVDPDGSGSGRDGPAKPKAVERLRKKAPRSS